MLVLIGLAGATTHIVNSGESLGGKCDIAQTGDTIEVYGSPNQDAECIVYADFDIVGKGSKHEVPSILVYADGAGIENLTFNAKSGSMLGVYGATGVQIHDVVFEGAGASASSSFYMLGGEVTGSGWLVQNHQSGSPIYIAGGGSSAVVDVESGTALDNDTSAFYLSEYAGQVEVTLSSWTFSGGTSEWGNGLGVFADGPDVTVTIENSAFSQMDAYAGAALTVQGTLIVRDSEFSDMTTSDEGGAIYCSYGCDINVERSTFERGHALRGGAIHVQGGTLEVDASDFYGNTGENGGGAIDASETGAVVVRDSLFCNNTTELYNGGAHLSAEVTDVTLSHNAFVGGSGGGSSSLVWVKSGGYRVEVVNNSFVEGRSVGTAATMGAADLTVTNNLFQSHLRALADNNAYADAISGESGYNAYIDVDDVGGFSPLFEMGNEYTSWTDAGYATPYSNVCGWEPLLAEGSVLIDAGHPDRTDGDGTRSDIGAYPYGDADTGDTEPPDSPVDSPVDSPIDSPVDSPSESDPLPESVVDSDVPDPPVQFVTGGCRAGLLGALLIPLGLVLLRRRQA